MGAGVWRDYGPSARLRVGGIEIAIITNNGQATDTAQLTSQGCDPTRKDTVVVKSNHHFSAAFEKLSREVITVDGGGLGSMILRMMAYRKVRRPVWPLDALT
jgi:microcystin degradation protein MlrC